MFQITKEMMEAGKYIDAINFVNQSMRGMESIVSNSIVSALEGNYGNYHRTKRTYGSSLWINPLMTIFWCFELRKVVQKLKYYDLIKDVNTIREFNGKLASFIVETKKFRKKLQLPI